MNKPRYVVVQAVVEVPYSNFVGYIHSADCEKNKRGNLLAKITFVFELKGSSSLNDHIYPMMNTKLADDFQSSPNLLGFKKLMKFRIHSRTCTWVEHFVSISF